jgi:hypothetical protein
MVESTSPPSSFSSAKFKAEELEEVEEFTDTSSVLTSRDEPVSGTKTVEIIPLAEEIVVRGPTKHLPGRGEECDDAT